jgi:hypothetical protein
MPRNVYFSQGAKSEQNLYEDLVIEALKIYGHEMYYMPRNMVSRDMILNEDIESKFDEAYMIEMYLENVDGFDGDGTFFSKFGLEIRDSATFVVSKRQWEKLVGLYNNEIVSGRPNEGDLLFFPLTRSFFEIKFVEHKSPFYQLSKVPVYKMRCELFEYSDEEIDTGIAEIDVLQTKFATEYFFAIDNSNDIPFTIGEKVKQVLSPAAGSDPEVAIYGKVLRFDRLIPTNPTSELRVALGEITATSGNYSEFGVTEHEFDKLVGLTSGAEWSITKKYDIDTQSEDLTFKNNAEGAQNYDFEGGASGIIDFSEHNPFGEVGASAPPVVTANTSFRADSTGIFADSTTLTADTQ